jgi:multimeric flavodoxin WrbA
MEEGIMSKVLVVNGCLRMEKSNTAKILTPFLEGIKQVGADVEMVYIKRLNIKPCQGDFNCWTRTLGVCHIDDDMQMLYPKMRDTDILVFATPVYLPLPGEMQNVLNRMVSLIDPVVKTRKGRTRARFFKDVKIKTIVLVSSSGWWEKENCGTVVRIIRELAEDASVKFAGALLRPHIDWLGKNQEKAKKIYSAAQQAGSQLITEGKMATKLLNIISQPLISNTRFLTDENR